MWILFTCFSVLWFLWDAVKSGHSFILIDERACTEKARKWGIKKSASKVRTSKFIDLIFAKHKPGKDSKNIERIRKRRKLVQSMKCKMPPHLLQKLVEDLKKEKILPCLQEAIESVNCVPLPEEEHFEELSLPVAKPHCVPQTILWDTQFSDIFQSDLLGYKFSPITLSESHELELVTRQQSQCNLWIEKRREILTASKFGSVIKRKKAVDQKFVNSLMTSRSIPRSNNTTTNYMTIGLDNEPAATSKYLQVNTSYSCEECGIVVNPGIPCLGATPDRIVKDKSGQVIGLLEIKTLSKCKCENIPTITEAIEKGMANFLKHTNGFICIKENSNQFYQIMGQLALTGLTFCDLLVDGGIEFFIQRIHFKKEVWLNDMLPKLLEFCSEHLKIKN
jgi:hypothetical protein